MDFNLKEESAYRVGSLISDLVSGADVQVGTVVNTAEIANSAVTTAKIADGNVTQPKVGSAAIASQNIKSAEGYQTGTGTLSSSVLWVVFPKVFTTSPFVTCSILDPVNAAGATGVGAGSVSVGSFYAIGATATAKFNWHAVGSYAAQ